jgi:hypothetical protein
MENEEERHQMGRRRSSDTAEMTYKAKSWKVAISTLMAIEIEHDD